MYTTMTCDAKNKQRERERERERGRGVGNRLDEVLTGLDEQVDVQEAEVLAKST